MTLRRLWQQFGSCLDLCMEWIASLQCTCDLPSSRSSPVHSGFLPCGAGFEHCRCGVGNTAVEVPSRGRRAVVLQKRCWKWRNCVSKRMCVWLLFSYTITIRERDMCYSIVRGTCDVRVLDISGCFRLPLSNQESTQK